MPDAHTTAKKVGAWGPGAGASHAGSVNGTPSPNGASRRHPSKKSIIDMPTSLMTSSNRDHHGNQHRDPTRIGD
ncbi:hypothetical protein NL676_000041 [Syzygium grande]|nr:hypothetical protein NL676_000041 [Syzygium grande]